MRSQGPYPWVMTASSAPEPCYVFTVRAQRNEVHTFRIRRHFWETSTRFHGRVRRTITRSLEAT